MHILSKCSPSLCAIVATSKSLLYESLTLFKCEECEWLKSRLISIVSKHITFIFWLNSNKMPQPPTTTTPGTLYTFYRNTLKHLKQTIIFVSPVFHQCFTKFLQCFTSVLQVFHQCSMSVSHVFSNVLPVCHQCTTSASPVFLQFLKSVLKVF